MSSRLPRALLFASDLFFTLALLTGCGGGGLYGLRPTTASVGPVTAQGTLNVYIGWSSPGGSSPGGRAES